MGSIKLKHRKRVPLQAALMKSVCPKCSCLFHWTAVYDDDTKGTAYRGVCCGTLWKMYPKCVGVIEDGGKWHDDPGTWVPERKVKS